MGCVKKDILLFQICSQFVLQGALHSSVTEKVNLSTVSIMTSQNYKTSATVQVFCRIKNSSLFGSSITKSSQHTNNKEEKLYKE